MQKSESIQNLAKALSAAQGTFGNPQKNKKNPFLNSKYADLASVWESCRQSLSENGLSFVQLPSVNGCTLTLLSVLMHESGEYLENELSVDILPQITKKEREQGIERNMPSVQELAGGITYLRRYAMQSILGLAADEDDDAESAVKIQGKRQQPIRNEQNRPENHLENAYSTIEKLWAEYQINTFEQAKSVKKNLGVDALRACKNIDALREYYRSHKEKYSNRKKEPATNQPSEENEKAMQQPEIDAGRVRVASSLGDNAVAMYDEAIQNQAWDTATDLIAQTY